MKQAYVKGTDVLIVGIKQQLYGMANISGFDYAGVPYFSGGTDINWDSQEDVPHPAGNGPVYMDDDGQEYSSAEIEFQEVVDDDNHP